MITPAKIQPARIKEPAQRTAYAVRTHGRAICAILRAARMTAMTVKAAGEAIR
jgi:hypothetical protein